MHGYKFRNHALIRQDLLQNATMWLRDTGMLDKMKWKNRVDDGGMEPFIPDPKVRVGKPLEITELGAAVFIEIGGVAIALVAFLVENCSPARCFGNGKGMAKVRILRIIVV